MSWGKNSFSCVALHQSPCLRVSLRLHDLILFDGCIISMYEDVQGKIPAWLPQSCPPAGGGPGVDQAVSVDREETSSNRSAWLRWRPGWMAPERTLVVETHVLPSGSAFMHPRRGPKIGDVVAEVLKPLVSGNCPESVRASPSYALDFISLRAAMEGFSSQLWSMGVSLRRATKYRLAYGSLWAQRRQPPVLSPSKMIIFPTQDDLGPPANRICRR